MITEAHQLLQVLRLVDEVWQENEVVTTAQGGEPQYSELSMFKVYVVSVLKKLWSHRSVWRVLQSIEGLRQACGLSQVPDRRTLDRRLNKMAAQAQKQLEAIGLCLVLEGVTDGSTAAGDGSAIAAAGARWDRNDQKAGRVPDKLRGVDKEAAWIQSTYHGWVYGYKAHVVTTVAPTTVRVVLTATLTGSDSESHVLRQLLPSLPETVATLLLDKGYDDEKLMTACRELGMTVIAPLHLPVGRTTSALRRQRAALLTTALGQARYQQRSSTIEPFFATIKDLFQLHRAPVRGLRQVAAIVLGALYSWNLLVLFNFLNHRPLGQLKPILELC